MEGAVHISVESKERRGHLKLDHEIRHRLFCASVSILDRLLNSSVRPRARSCGVDGGSPRDAKLQFVFTSDGTGRRRSTWKSTWWHIGAAPWLAPTSSDKGNRLGQRQCLHQPEADTVVRGTRNRVHPFLGYCKSGLARIVQWKAAVVRRLAGLHRYSGRLAGHTMVHLYRMVRPQVNCFQPSFMPLVETREGTRVVKQYSSQVMPCDW